jgi:IS6 family transposase
MVWPWRLRQCRTRQGFDVHWHTTVFRWVQRYAPELGKLCCLHLKTTNSSYCVDETSFKVKSCGSASTTPSILQASLLFPTQRDSQYPCSYPIFLSSLTRDACTNSLGITVDKHAVYPSVFEVMHWKGVPLRDVHSSVAQVINNMVEQDHRCVKR